MLKSRFVMNFFCNLERSTYVLCYCGKGKNLYAKLLLINWDPGKCIIVGPCNFYQGWCFVGLYDDDILSGNNNPIKAFNG